MRKSGAPKTAGMDSEIGSSLWVAPNPFGEPASYLLLYPDGAEVDDAARDALVDLSARLGLKKFDEDGDIPFVGTDVMDVGLRGATATLWNKDQEWLTFQAPTQWTAKAISRRYVVLVIGAQPHPGSMDAQQISDYLDSGKDVYLGLVRIRVRVEAS